MNRKPQIPLRIFAERRQLLAQRMPESALIIPAYPEHIRNHDVHHPYRANSNLFYLTGFEEPETILVFRPGKTPETVLFVRKKDKDRETWDGFRYGPEGAEEFFRVDKAYPIEAFEIEAPKLLKDVEKVYYRLMKDPANDLKVLGVLETLRRNQGRTGYGLLPIYDADELLGELRVKKTDYDLDQLRKACEISAETHLAVMRHTKPGINEREIHGLILQQFMQRGSAREGYGSIVAAGSNATTLHYVFNDSICRDGDLLLVDAGAEYNYYTGDVTRTFPINGKFSKAQKVVYEGVLSVQKTVLNHIKPGVAFKELHDMATSLLTDLMLELGLLTGRKSDIIESGDQKKYYPHGVGHWLGMDVHDAGLYFHKNEPRPIENNMSFTVEPGLYIPADDLSAPAEFRGIGVRIEDNIRVTPTGHENMTQLALKEVADLEKIVGIASTK